MYVYVKALWIMQVSVKEKASTTHSSCVYGVIYSAVVRSAIKNFSLAFFFPVCLTVFFFTHNRTGYDIISSSIVVELPEDDIWAPRPLR